MDNKDISLKEESAYPANPDSEYGWEKLFSERLYLSFLKNYGLDVKVARFHNIYGPLGVRGRNSNNDLIRETLQWDYQFTLKEGITQTYNWIDEQVGLLKN